VAADGDDGTRELALETARQGEPVRVIGNRERSGKGRGVREAMGLARGNIAGYADADNKVPIEEFDKFRPWLGQSFDVVIGSRSMRESQIEKRQPLYRQLGGKGFGLFMHAVVGLAGISDTQCGFKFFTRAAAREIFSRQQIDGYMFDVEILVLARRLGYRIQQVPIRWRDDGDSRLALVRGNLRNVADIFRIGARARRSRGL
jgi:dolichyl-phosphate beta-glucosyltransferase